MNTRLTRSGPLRREVERAAARGDAVRVCDAIKASVDMDALAPYLRTHAVEMSVYFDDTDMSGVVYHANYLKYFSRARADLIGIDNVARLYTGLGLDLVVHTAELTFLSPARLGNRLTLKTQLSLPTVHKLEFVQWAERTDDGGTVAEGRFRLVCVGKAGLPVPVPLAQMLRVTRAERRDG